MFTGRRCGGTATIFSPSSNMRPSVGVSKPASMRNSVVLPHPDGPSSAKNSACAMSSVRAPTAVTAPKCLLTASKRTTSCVSALVFAASPSAIDSSFRARTLAGRADRSTRHLLILELLCGRGQRALHRLFPSGIFVLPDACFHARFKTSIELPLRGETIEIRRNAGSPSCEIRRAQCRRFHHIRPIDGTCEDVCQELHGEIACGHAAIDAQHGGRRFRCRPICMHGLEQVACLISHRLKRCPGKLRRTGISRQTEDRSPRLGVPIGSTESDKRRHQIDLLRRIGALRQGPNLGRCSNKLQFIAQPLHGGACNKDGSFQRISALALKLIGDRREQPSACPNPLVAVLKSRKT